jgi:hypothetical protein
MKRVSVLLFAVFCALNLYAQERPIFGLKAGLNLAKTTNDNGLSRDLKAGLHAGVLAHIHLTHQFALQPELVYSGQGAKYTVLGDEHNLNLNYVTIPVMLQFMFDNGFRLQTGPQLGFLFDVNDKFNGNETGFFTSDDFKTIDFSWGFGLGYLGYSGFGVDARYNLGVSNINDNTDPDLNSKVRNSVIQIGVFYMLDKQHKRKSK